MKNKVHTHDRSKTIQESGNTIQIDTQYSFGYPSAKRAIEQGCNLAKDSNIAIVAIKNAHHLGRIGIFSEICAEQGLISIHFVNVVGHPGIVAPYGGIKAGLGTNPFCCGIPNPDGDNIILDMATSKIAYGKLREAYAKGESVPKDSLIDKNGNFSTEPSAFYQGGALTPFGEYKGFGIALICEVLAGALVGNWTMATPNPITDTIVNHMLSIVIKPGAISNEDIFYQEIQRLIIQLKSNPSMTEQSVQICW